MIEFRVLLYGLGVSFIYLSLLAWKHRGLIVVTRAEAVLYFVLGLVCGGVWIALGR